ncbi:MAG: formyltransferase family protein [Chloroflexota bacterium]
MTTNPLRIVTFNFLPIAYRSLTNWIKEAGHTHVLAVTTPGPKSRPTPSYIDVVGAAPRNVDVLVTTRLRKVATPLIRELKPDLITCFSFPYRITPELCEIPTYGAVNLHPAVLPAYRGPNVMRQFYDGASVFGATAHWIAEEYDTGRILSQKSAPMPDEVTPETVFPTWGMLIAQAIAEGMEKAIAGEPGWEQDDAQVTYAAPYTEEERWLDWQDPCQVLQRKVTGLNMVGAGYAKAKVGEETIRIFDLKIVANEVGEGVPGKLLERTDEGMVVQAMDGVVRIQTQPLEE